MRKVFVLAAAAALVAPAALADGEMASKPYFGGVFFGRTSMDLPDHANGAIQFGATPTSQTLSANVDGNSYAIGIGKELDTGWRVVAIFRYFDGEGAAGGARAFAASTPFIRGPVSGGTPPGFLDVISGGDTCTGAAACAGTEQLDTDVQEWGGSVSAGRMLFGPVHGDLVFTYTATDTDFDHFSTINFTAPAGTGNWSTNTNFASAAAELAARLSADFALMNGISAGIGGSAGYEYRHTNMTDRQRVFTSVGGVLGASSIDVNDGEYGFVGRADANISWALTDRLSLAAVGNYVSDSQVPVYVAPNYVTHTAASFKFETQSSTTYGLRLLTRW